MTQNEDCAQLEVAASECDLKVSKDQLVGNVKLLEGKQIVLIPTPSPDPNGLDLTPRRSKSS